MQRSPLSLVVLLVACLVLVALAALEHPPGMTEPGHASHASARPSPGG